MVLATRLTELAKKTQQHREVLLTEQAAKTALVMPFINLLGYDVFVSVVRKPPSISCRAI